MAGLALGLLFGLVYEILRIIRLLIPFKAVTFICDILFFYLSAQAITALSLSLGSYIRFYTVLGFGCGVFSYINTIGRLLNFLENKLIGGIRSALLKFFGKIGKLFGSVFVLIAHKTTQLFRGVHKVFQKRLKKAAKLLKKEPVMVYNKESHKHNMKGSAGNVIKANVKRRNNT